MPTMDATSRRRNSTRDSNQLKPVRRIVTGYDQLNRAVIVSDGAPTHVQTLSRNGPTYYEIWSTRESPARIGRGPTEPNDNQLASAPPTQGTRILILDVLPERRDPVVVNAGMAHAPMHRTESIDYAIVLQGEITLILDDGETQVHAGDVVVQRGTHHTWANKSGRLCRIALVLIDAKFDDNLK
jgi:hypothetical protein